MNINEITGKLREFANEMERTESARIEGLVEQGHIQADIKRIRIRVSEGPPNQDAFSVLILADDKQGNQWYVDGFHWHPYKGYDLLDISKVAFHGDVTVKAKDTRANKSRGA